jgi:hypothetical protein
MTEVRKSPFGSLGLFATKPFAKGDLILEEHPVVTVAPLSDDESKSLMIEFVGGKKQSSKKNESASVTLWSAMEPPALVPLQFRGTFRGMVQAGLCWMKRQPLKKEDVETLLQFYHPSKDTSSPFEKSILQISGQAMEYLKQHVPAKYADFDDWETLEQVLLIWACNSFEGGHLYPQISRVNHDCNPNALIQPREEAQRLVVAADIAEGDEITISYLGLMLYAETSVRKDCLQKSKFFECHCTRCSSNDGDKAARTPCPTCHPCQVAQQCLDEDVQYDDDQTVQYMTLTAACSKCHAKLEKESKLQRVRLKKL